MVKFFKRNYILFIYTIIPFGSLFGFILEKLGFVNIGLNFVRITILLLLYKNTGKNKILLALFIVAYFCFNLIFFPGDLSVKSSELTSYILYLSALFSSKYLLQGVENITAKDAYKFFSWFTSIYVIAFIITALMTGKVVTESKYDTRAYYNGFVISHLFSYMTILFAFVFLKFKKWVPFVFLCVLALSVGNRTSFFVMAAAALIYFEGNGNLFVKKTVRISSYVVAIAIVFILFYSIFISEYLTNTKILYILSNPEYISLTSGRSYFWYFGIIEMNKAALFSFESIFGRGPASVQLLLYDMLKVKLWMHNDFMQIIYCYGLFGIGLTAYGLYYFLKVLKTTSVIWFIIIASMINGFYTYDALQLLIMMTIILRLNTKKTNTFVIYPTSNIINSA